MTTRESNAPTLRYARNPQGRKAVLDLDLNVVPPMEDQYQEGSSSHHGPWNVPPVQLGGAVPLTVIDLEAFDDDVLLSSPRAFAEGKNHFRIDNGHNILVDVDREELSCRIAPNNDNKSRRISANRTIINCDLYVNFEGSSNSTVLQKQDFWSVAPPLPSLPPPPTEPTFTCPVCMGPLVEEMSTKCGHIFCKACIKNAIAAQNKCPTCRRKVTKKNIIRIYLPATRDL